MKNLTALIAAFIVTGIIGIALFGIGFSALVNTNTVPLSSTPSGNTTVQVSNQVQVQQLENRLVQYQDRLNQAVEQLNTQNTQIQQYQQLLQALVARGVIVIREDGSVLIPGR
jgi:TolA-binding protein